MNRFDQLITAIQAEYAGDTTQWYTRVEDLHRHDNWDRIVAYPSTGVIAQPPIGAKGVVLSTINAQAEPGAIDDIVWVRRTTVNLVIWAQSYERAENRLHALLVAIATVIGQSDIDLSDIREQWIRSEAQDLVPGGAVVVLSFVASFYVLASDTTVLATEIDDPDGEPGAIGTGTPTETVEEIVIVAEQEAEDGSAETIYQLTILPEET